jgi:hypothetical protein
VEEFVVGIIEHIRLLAAEKVILMVSRITEAYQALLNSINFSDDSRGDICLRT